MHIQAKEEIALSFPLCSKRTIISFFDADVDAKCALAYVQAAHLFLSITSSSYDEHICMHTKGERERAKKKSERSKIRR